MKTLTIKRKLSSPVVSRDTIVMAERRRKASLDAARVRMAIERRGRDFRDEDLLRQCWY